MGYRRCRTVRCPDENTLAAFVLGEVKQDEIAVIESHIDRCSRCADTVASVAEMMEAGGTARPRTRSEDELSDGNRETLAGAESFVGELSSLIKTAPEHYEFGAEIARGGMGRIVLARDRNLGRDIAIKELLSPSPALRRRFERELRITARLQHPAIISVLDAGRWPSGEPFYVMKYIKGRPLDEVIKETTTIAERLALLSNVIAVADALAYAHDEHVIHRDLKPANVLVGNYGETVVIDWGLAKDLRCDDAQEELVAEADPDGDDALTVAGRAMGTPAYMSPKQARAEPVDQQADVYALGAMLYHLLAGQTPYLDKKPKSTRELLARVRSEPPTPLPELAPDVPSDLLAIVDKAMARSVANRYGSAKDVAEDLRRFQNGHRVGVHQYTSRQLVGRWLRRHLAAVSVAAAAIVVLAVGAIVSVSRVVREQRETEVARKLAEQGRADAETFMDFMLVDVFKKLEPIGQTPLLRVVANEASNYYKRRPQARSSGDQQRRALALRNLGDVLLEQGDAALAMSEYRASLAITKRLVSEDPTNVTWQRDLSVTHVKVGKVLLAQGDAALAMSEYQASLAITKKLASEDPTNATWQRDLSVSQETIGNVLLAQGDASNALAQYRAALAIAEKLATEDPTNATNKHDLVVSHVKIGDVLKRQDAALALSEYQAALAIAEKLVTEDPSNVTWQHTLAVTHDSVGIMLLAQGQPAGALDEYRAAMGIREKLASEDPTNVTGQRNLAVSHDKIGDVLAKLGDAAKAMSEYSASLAITKKLVAQDSTNATWQHDLAGHYIKVGNLFLGQGDTASAMREYGASLAILEKQVAEDPTNATWQTDLAICHVKVGNVHLAEGHASEALASYRASLAVREKLASQDPTNLSWQRQLLISHDHIGRVLEKQGDTSQALAEYRLALALAEKLATEDPTKAQRKDDLLACHYQIGAVLVAQGDTSQALVSYRLALAIAEDLASKNPASAERQNDLSEVRKTMASCCASEP